MNSEHAFLAELSYAIPLVVAIVLALLVAWWSRARTGKLPSMVPAPPPGHAVSSPDKSVYLSLSDGRFLLTIDLLGRRLARAVEGRYHVKLEEARALASLEVELPEPLTLSGVLDDLLGAYRTAAVAERPSWLNARWAWLRRRRHLRAASRFSIVLDEVKAALAALEAA